MIYILVLQGINGFRMFQPQHLSRPALRRFRNPMNIYYVNGAYMPASEATIPVDDLALLRGYGVFDLLRTFQGKPMFLKEHLARLKQSAAKIDLEFPWTQKQLIEIVRQTLARNPQGEYNIRLVVTGGSSPDFITPQGQPRLLVLVTPFAEQPQWWYTDGVKVITTTAIERHIPGAKSIDYIPATIALKNAKRQGAVEAIYMDRDRNIQEGTTSNLFVFKGNQLLTPAEGVLKGITRQVVLQLCEPMFEVVMRNLRYDEFVAADEVFITGTKKGLVPVIQVDETTIGDGRPGSRTRQVMQALQDYIAACFSE